MQTCRKVLALFREFSRVILSVSMDSPRLTHAHRRGRSSQKYVLTISCIMSTGKHPQGNSKLYSTGQIEISTSVCLRMIHIQRFLDTFVRMKNGTQGLIESPTGVKYCLLVHIVVFFTMAAPILVTADEINCLIYSYLQDSGTRFSSAIWPCPHTALRFQSRSL